MEGIQSIVVSRTIVVAHTFPRECNFAGLAPRQGARFSSLGYLAQFWLLYHCVAALSSQCPKCTICDFSSTSDIAILSVCKSRGNCKVSVAVATAQSLFIARFIRAYGALMWAMGRIVGASFLGILFGYGLAHCFEIINMLYCSGMLIWMNEQHCNSCSGIVYTSADLKAAENQQLICWSELLDRDNGLVHRLLRIAWSVKYTQVSTVEPRVKIMPAMPVLSSPSQVFSAVIQNWTIHLFLLGSSGWPPPELPYISKHRKSFLSRHVHNSSNIHAI